MKAETLRNTSERSLERFNILMTIKLSASNTRQYNDIYLCEESLHAPLQKQQLITSEGSLESFDVLGAESKYR
jgi:hypothetical protein